MWQASASADPPASAIASATALHPSSLRLATMTCAPCAARVRAMASPMPREPPVTRATLHERSKRGSGVMAGSVRKAASERRARDQLQGAALEHVGHGAEGGEG